MKLLSLFSGIGAFEKALDRMGVNYELVNFCEFDKYATKSYCAIHGVDETKNLGDITMVDETKLPKDIDLITYGFPCQDISNAGKQKGLFNEDGTQTRSGLFFEALRIIEATKPKIAIAENVKNLVGKKFKDQFEIVLNSLEEAGYNNYWQVLNAKDFGIPQNRERVFIVSIRKDLDTGSFEFPTGFQLELRLKDMLDDEVDENYYIDMGKVKQFILNNPTIDESKAVLGTCHERNDLSFATRDRVYNSEKESPTLTATMYKDPPKILQVAQIYPNSGNPQAGRIYDDNGISPSLDTCSGGNRMPKVIKVGNINPSGRGMNGVVVDSQGLSRTITTEKGEGQKILVREATKKGYAEAVEGDSINLEHPNSKTRRGRVGRQVAQTLTTSPQQGVVING